MQTQELLRYELKSPGSYRSLECVSAPMPAPKDHEVLVHVKACSLNYRDLVVARGQYGKTPPNLVPLSDMAGEVIAAGKAVTRISVGDRVSGSFFQSWLEGEPQRDTYKSALGGAIHGVLATHVVLHEDGLVHIPETLSFEEAATLPCAGVTAWHALGLGTQKIGKVLLLGTGGVSLIGLQLAKAMGSAVFITSSSDQKLQRAKEMGADFLINYKSNPDWEKEVLDLTEGAGVDLVLEVGGAGTLEKSLRATRVGGRIALIGVLAGGDGKANPFMLAMKSQRMDGIYVGSRAMYESLLRFVSEYKIKPFIGKVFSFDQALEAYEYLEDNLHFGKVVVTLQEA